MKRGVKSIPVLLFAWLIFSQATRNFHLIQNEYFYRMEMEINREEIKQIVLSDSSRFSYTIRQVEITNILGVAVAVLDEYFITDAAGETYKLHKTNKGNWYDVPEVNTGFDKGLLMELKLTFDNF